jgi:thioredoxin 1
VGGVLAEGLDSAPLADTTPLPEADINTFHPLLAAAGDALVVVDFYTSWCGPCKLIAPKLALWNAELQPAVQFIKVNCNKEFAPLGKQLGIKVAPTFHLYRKGALLAVLTGAKEEALRALIEEHKTAR